MNALVACEESQRVTMELRKLGVNAFSCDIIPCSGGHPEWHIQGDVLPLLNGKCEFMTTDGANHVIKGKWNLIIAHPPCTYLTNAGTRHYSLKCTPPDKVAARIRERERASKFFMEFVEADCEHIAIENPVGWMNSHYRPADQTIQPYWFGENAEKRTCLWLKNLPKLYPTKLLQKPEPLYYCQGGKKKGKPIGWCEGMRDIHGGQAERAKARSKTFQGIAHAMAIQWAWLCEEDNVM